MILIDNDVLIDDLRRVLPAGVVLAKIAQAGGQAVSVFTRLELLVGTRNLVDKQQVKRLLRGFRVLTVSTEISELADRLVTAYWLSNGLHFVDAHIAATAIVHGVLLVSKNQRYSRYIPGLQLLPYPAAPAT